MSVKWSQPADKSIWCTCTELVADRTQKQRIGRENLAVAERERERKRVLMEKSQWLGHDWWSDGYSLGRWHDRSLRPGSLRLRIAPRCVGGCWSTLLNRPITNSINGSNIHTHTHTNDLLQIRNDGPRYNPKK